MRTPKLLQGFNRICGEGGHGSWVGYHKDDLEFIRKDDGVWVSYFRGICVNADKKLCRCYTKSLNEIRWHLAYDTAALAALEGME